MNYLKRIIFKISTKYIGIKIKIPGYTIIPLWMLNTPFLEKLDTQMMLNLLKTMKSNRHANSHNSETHGNFVSMSEAFREQHTPLSQR